MQSSESVSYDASVSFINTVADDRSESPANGTLPQTHDRGQRRPLRVEQLEWLRYFHRCSRLLVAVLEPNTLKLRYANEYFCRLSGIPLDGLDPSQVCVDRAQIFLESLLADEDYLRVVRLYRKHLLHRVLEEIYHIDPRGYRLLDEPVRVAIASVLHHETRYIEFGLRSEQLTISRINPDLDEFAELGWQSLTPEALEFKLTDVRYLQNLVEQLRIDNYRVEGRLLLEGVDVTANETIRRITQDSILQPAKFHEVNQQINLLFRANNSAIASIDGDQVRLFTGSVSEDVDGITYSMDELRDSHLMEAVRSNRVTVVPDLAHDCRNEYGQKLLELGMRSLLILPLMRVDEHLSNPENILLKTIGAVGIMSDQPNNFDALDCRQAEELIPAFTAAVTAAQRQLVQRRFITNIHPSVEWRFLQEAERRSLGLPPEPIVFTSVYPLYGISDIRGSSDERNRAIQADLLEQFQLGLAIVEAAGKNQDAALIDQLRLDLLEQIHHLNEPVTVDAEVSLVRYLRDNLEVYFDYFALAGAEAQAAIAVYQTACDNPQNCVYRARATYDSTVGKINAMLRETWERWQKRMQRISPHYCDIEATDGIDHMIYAGQSIDPKFGSFQLRSLRYEQLRAVCDCARTSFRIQKECNTNMEVTHLVLVQDSTVDIYHDETV